MRLTRKFDRWLVALRALVLASAGAYAFASMSAQAGLSARDADNVRLAVQSQLAALAANDAERAFSLASPDVQQSFGGPRQFLAMVRAQYPMVQKPAAVSFTRPESVGDRVMQRVNITDENGAPWLVTYLLRRDGDKRWRISACVVAPAHRHVVA